MIVWRGYGILVVVMAIIGILLGDFLAASMWGTPVTPEHKSAGMLIGLLVAAALVFGLHVALERSSAPRTYIDKATGREVRMKAKHDLFYIPVKYWSIVLVAIGLFAFFKG